MDNIVNKIRELIESKNLSASDFADLIGVKRANVSHVLSGRNKPSLEFVLKISEAFNDLDLNELLIDRPIKIDNNNQTQERKIFDSPINEKINELNLETKDKSKLLDRIVLFFNDGSFKEYINDNT